MIVIKSIEWVVMFLSIIAQTDMEYGISCYDMVGEDLACNVFEMNKCDFEPPKIGGMYITSCLGNVCVTKRVNSTTPLIHQYRVEIIPPTTFYKNISDNTTALFIPLVENLASCRGKKACMYTKPAPDGIIQISNLKIEEGEYDNN